MRFIKSVAEAIVIAGLAVLVVVVVRQYVFNPYAISGGSMLPNLKNGDYVIVDQLSYRLLSVKRGEVIVFRGPASSGENLLKRVIGLPGERLVIQDNAVTIFNAENPEGWVLDESYLDADTVTSGDVDIVLEENQYFVMGDNRSISFDSRSWGPLNAERILGKVALRIWPPDATQAFGAEQY